MKFLCNFRIEVFVQLKFLCIEVLCNLKFFRKIAQKLQIVPLKFLCNFPQNHLEVGFFQLPQNPTVGTSKMSFVFQIVVKNAIEVGIIFLVEIFTSRIENVVVENHREIGTIFFILLKLSLNKRYLKEK